MPLGTLGLEHVEAARDALFGAAAARELKDKDGKREDKQKHQVDYDESRSAILAGDVGETPDVSQPDGASRRREEKAHP